MYASGVFRLSVSDFLLSPLGMGLAMMGPLVLFLWVAIDGRHSAITEPRWLRSWVRTPYSDLLSSVMACMPLFILLYMILR